MTNNAQSNYRYICFYSATHDQSRQNLSSNIFFYKDKTGNAKQVTYMVDRQDDQGKMRSEEEIQKAIDYYCSRFPDAKKVFDCAKFHKKQKLPRPFI